MKLKKFYQEVVSKGIEADVRSKKEIDSLLKDKKKQFEALGKKEKENFDKDCLFNPYADTRILVGDLEDEVKTIIVGVDVDVGEIVAIDRLNQKGKKIDLAVSHHPQGHAYAHFYEVMDVQVDICVKEGLSLGVSQNLLEQRKAQVARRVSAANHLRAVNIANLLDINFLCMHTPCDNLAYLFLRKKLDKIKPSSLGEIMDILSSMPEYNYAAKNNNPPQIVIGSNKSRCKNIHLEFTGGTEGPKEIYKELSSSGIDTIIAMHQSEEHFKKCKEANINVIFASHIASDNLGINLMLDHLESKQKLKIYEFSGFRRFNRKNKK